MAATNHAQPVPPSIEDAVSALLTMQVAHAHLIQSIGSQHRLNPADMRALKFIASQPRPTTPKEIGIHMRMGTGAVTAMLDRLEARNVVYRERNPEDRRSVLIQLLPGGTAVVNALVAAYRHAFRAILDAGEGAAFLGVVEALGEQFGAEAEGVNATRTGSV